MGASVSASQQVTNVVQSVATNVSSSVINNTMNTTSASNNVVNNLTIENHGTMNCGSGFTATQKIDSRLGASIQFVAQNSADIANQISTQFQNMLTTSLQQSQSGLIFGANVNISNSVSNMNSQMTASLNQIVQNTISNTIDLSQTGQNSITIKNYGTISGSQCTFDQEAISSLVVSNISSAITQAVTSTQAFTDLTSQAQTSSTQSTTGIDATTIALVAIVAVGIGVVIFMQFGSGIVKAYFSEPPGKYVKYMIAGIIGLLVVALIVYLIYLAVEKAKSSSSKS